MRVYVSLTTLCLFLLQKTNVESFQQPSIISIGQPKLTTTTSLKVQDDENTNNIAGGRRAFVTSGVMAVASSLFLPQLAVADGSGGGSSVDYKAVAQDIMDLVKKNPDWGPSEFAPMVVVTHYCFLFPSH